ncbi:MAG: 1-acyl-sn-glycerol-3-phosphate acyltransferase [Thermoleophilia bacterium]|nr:1-acyl-sn-glycerol-3-phosphate acyltransferase [Thermoleophilia bacterium]
MSAAPVRDALVPVMWWTVGKGLFGTLAWTAARLKAYGRERVPREGGAVLAMNHFHYMDPAAFGAACPRRIVFAAKIEAHRAPVLGSLIRSHGTLSIRRGESDRDALRRMREAVRGNDLLGMFIEGTRQRSGVPGEGKPGAAMVAINEGVPIVPAAVYGSLEWNWNLKPVSVAFGEPMRFDTYTRNGAGYRAATEEVMFEIRRLWAFLAELHRLGRPPGTPPRRAELPVSFP